MTSSPKQHVVQPDMLSSSCLRCLERGEKTINSNLFVDHEIIAAEDVDEHLEAPLSNHVSLNRSIHLAFIIKPRRIRQRHPLCSHFGAAQVARQSAKSTCQIPHVLTDTRILQLPLTPLSQRGSILTLVGTSLVAVVVGRGAHVAPLRADFGSLGVVSTERIGLLSTVTNAAALAVSPPQRSRSA